MTSATEICVGHPRELMPPACLVDARQAATDEPLQHFRHQLDGMSYKPAISRALDDPRSRAAPDVFMAIRA